MEQSDWQYKDIHTILREGAEQHGGKVYIESPDQVKNLTYEQTYAWCNRIANLLKQQGIKSSDKITLIGENSIETLLVYFGVLNYGAIISSINVEESKENIYNLLNFIKPRIVFHNKKLTFDHEAYKADLWIPYADFDIESRQRNELFSLLQQHSPIFDDHIGSREDIFAITFTSGTTATPKAVVTSREPFLYLVRQTIDRLRITERDVILDYRGYNWQSTLLISILSSLLAGATLVFARKFSRSRFPSWLKEYNITIAIGVPTVINILVQEPVPLHKKDVPFLRFMTSSSAPLMVQNQQEFEKRYGILLNQLAGGQEIGLLGMGDPEDLKHPEKRKIASVGKPLRNSEVLILDENGNRCKAGEIGEMVVRCKSTALGYLQPNGEISRFPEDGVPTGDLGYLDSDGYIYITGRKKELIIRGGVNISPMEITEWLIKHPAVQEAATFGVPDKVRGEEVASFIVPKAGHKVNEQDIINHCKKKLPDFKIPKTVYFIEQIPKTGRGKVAKKDLVKIWEEIRQKV
jgi:long-chain acyl-CoA synthetase